MFLFEDPRDSKTESGEKKTKSDEFPAAGIEFPRSRRQDRDAKASDVSGWGGETDGRRRTEDETARGRAEVESDGRGNGLVTWKTRCTGCCTRKRFGRDAGGSVANFSTSSCHFEPAGMLLHTRADMVTRRAEMFPSRKRG